MENSKIKSEKDAIKDLIALVESLRGEHGCPWDKKQTPKTMLIYLMEEMYELVDAIESNRVEDVREELGDVLFHIVFIARMFQELGKFDLSDVAQSITEKMIRRHPHVFAEENVKTSEEIVENWHKIKLSENKSTGKQSSLDSVPAQLPALIRAYRISDRLAKTGFDWNDIPGVMQKVEEEWSEFKALVERENRDPTDQDFLALEFGDVLFTLVNVARFAHIHPETALRNSTKKFENRFKYMEKLIAESQRIIESVSQEEKDKLWEEAKAKMTVS